LGLLVLGHGDVDGDADGNLAALHGAERKSQKLSQNLWN
jgi:hypothetical protein